MPATSTAARYQQRRPEATVLYAIVQRHLESFLSHVTETTERRLPRYVEQEFRRYLQCGILAHGFSRAACTQCGHELLLPFSCKLRGACPGCNARRACNTAAHLVDRVLPDVPLRQWVLSVPFELRLLLARTPAALSAVGRLFVQEIERWQRGFALFRGHCGPDGRLTVDCGAVSFPQRFGGSLNLNVHYHVIAPDGVFVAAASDVGRSKFIQHPAPERAELEEILRNTAHRVVNWLTRSGYLLPTEDESTEVAPGALDACLQGALGVGLLQEPEGSLSSADAVAKSAKRGRRSAIEFMGFNLHAAVRVAAGCPAERERLLRYCARAPLSLERLGMLADGRITYRMQHGSKVRVMSPVQFMARLAALIPPPRHPLIRFCGVFAPHHSRRSRVIPVVAAKGAPATEHSRSNPSIGGAADKPAGTAPGGVPVTGSLRPKADGKAALCTREPRREPAEPHGSLPTKDNGLSRIDWATLLKRVYTVDALACTECGGRMRFTDVFEDKRDIGEELTRRGLPCEAPPLARARAPDWQDT